MISMPETLPDDPAALKRLLAEVLSSAQELAKDKDRQIERLRGRRNDQHQRHPVIAGPDGHVQ